MTAYFFLLFVVCLLTNFFPLISKKMTAAVISVEDHGYVMDVGIADARSFLTKQPNEDLAIGQIVSVCVTGCQIEGHVATLTLSTEESIKFKQNVELNLSTLIPKTKLHVTISKVNTCLYTNAMGRKFNSYFVGIPTRFDCYLW